MPAWRAIDRPRTGPSSGLGKVANRIACLLLLVASFTSAYDLDPDDRDSIKSIAKDMVEDMMTFYPGNKPGGTPGLLNLPYYWWEGGALMGALVDYWYYTGDTSWNEVTMEGLLFQVGDEEDYMPRNQTHTEGNDDQGFWGLAAMTAAEYNFPDPPSDKPQWLALAQAVFNTQAARWDTEYCDGGLRWQIFTWNNGYDYKNTISQACFFALGARLALYTGNSSYSDWAEKTWDWTAGVGYIDEDYKVYDGAYIQDGCNELTPYQWTYNIGGFLLGAAAMYNYTEDDVWKTRVNGLLGSVTRFFRGDEKNLMTEITCEPSNTCNIDQQSFKAYLSRWLANVVTWYPASADAVMPLLRASSVAAAAQCTGGDNGRMCGLEWTDGGEWDGSTGLGQQMAALQVSLANLVRESRAPTTADTGGTSRGDSGAGGADIGRTDPVVWEPITAGDRAGAGILTAVILGLFASAVAFMVGDDVREAAAGRGPLGGVLGCVPAARRGKGKGVEMEMGPGPVGRRPPGMFLTGRSELPPAVAPVHASPRQWLDRPGASAGVGRSWAPGDEDVWEPSTRRNVLRRGHYQ